MEEKKSPWAPEIIANEKGVEFEQLKSLDGRVVRFIHNGDNFTPDM